MAGNVISQVPVWLVPGVRTPFARVDAGLRALDAVAASPTPVRWLVITAEPVTSVDVTAADIVAKLDETLQAAGIELCFAEMKDPVQDKLKRFGLFSRLGAEVFFPTIGEAVNTYLRTYPDVAVEWKKSDSRPG